MNIVYTRQDPPDGWKHALFLAGPTPRSEDMPSWRPEALKILEDLGYDGVVFAPECPPGEFWDDGADDYDAQCNWERKCLRMADIIVFWVPRDLEDMPAYTTNIEFGTWITSGKVVYGRPDAAPKNKYLDWLGREAAQIEPHSTLKATLEAALSGYAPDKAPVRAGGLRYVPACVYQTPMFQAWYKAQTRAGNRLDEADVRWMFRLPNKARTVFSYVLWVKVWVTSEERHKANEYVFARSDVATTVLYQKPKGMGDIYDTEILLIREFRSPTRTTDGFIHELPGGGCEGADDSARIRASKEVYEETGLALDKNRFQAVGSRQAVGTLSSHQIHGFSVELTAAEMAHAKKMAEEQEVHGEDGTDGEEQTYIEIKTVKDLLNNPDVDWSNLGIVMRAVTLG